MSGKIRIEITWRVGKIGWLGRMGWRLIREQIVAKEIIECDEWLVEGEANVFLARRVEDDHIKRMVPILVVRDGYFHIRRLEAKP